MYTHKCGISEYNQTKNLQFIRKIFAIIIFYLLLQPIL